MSPLDSVTPNDWNPNRMTARQYAATVHGMRADGWVSSQPLLIWRTDESGMSRMLIVDGEHRWRAAMDLGFEEGPMVFLDGVSRSVVQALTIKLDAKRGAFDSDLLSSLVIELAAEYEGEDLALDLGFEDAEMAALLAEPEPLVVEPEDDAGSGPDDGIQSRSDDVKSVHLLYETADYERFMELAKALAESEGLTNASDTVLRALELLCRD
jgi:ParB-like chromosome segregation protein Spo0J